MLFTAYESVFTRRIRKIREVSLLISGILGRAAGRPLKQKA
jgi:hypothetical protein